MNAPHAAMATVLLALLAAVQPGCSSSPGGVGTAAPNVTLVGMDDTRFDLASLRGRTVLLNFWFYH
jgi:cytochrome oxidase Cu insertion factor (SCO1/SenC/PrrC family)